MHISNVTAYQRKYNNAYTVTDKEFCFSKSECVAINQGWQIARYSSYRYHLSTIKPIFNGVGCFRRGVSPTYRTNDIL